MISKRLSGCNVAEHVLGDFGSSRLGRLGTKPFVDPREDDHQNTFLYISTSISFSLSYLVCCNHLLIAILLFGIFVLKLHSKSAVSAPEQFGSQLVDLLKS